MQKPPFVYFGKKYKCAPEIWRRFGDITRYVEPFCGSAAVLLQRPKPKGVEVIGDLNLHLVNFWRAVGDDPDKVAHFADRPSLHIDLPAIHNWLKDAKRHRELRDKFLDLEYPGNHQQAGLWMFGQIAALGNSWSRAIYGPKEGLGPSQNLLTNAMMSSNDRVKHCLQQLCGRVKSVRVLHNGWEQTLFQNCGNDRIGVFFDPPYKDFEYCYGEKGEPHVADKVEAWCLENQDTNKICLAGYVGDYELPGWSTYLWKQTKGFYGSKNSRAKECLWFSPNCLSERKVGFFK